MLKLSNVHAGYGKTEILHGIDIELSAGELVSVVGPNGCGKSTLLKTATGILTPTEGTLTLQEEPLCGMSTAAAARKIAYLAQGKSTPEMTVGEMVLHGRFPHLSYPRRYGKKDKAIALQAMEHMGISELSERPLSTLSGGMRQKAYLAMALTQETELILLDEPTTFLDISNSISLMNTLCRLREDGKGILTVLHDLPLAMAYSDRVIVMDGGCIVSSGTPEEIFKSGVIGRVFGVELIRDKENYYFKQRQDHD